MTNREWLQDHIRDMSLRELATKLVDTTTDEHTGLFKSLVTDYRSIFLEDVVNANMSWLCKQYSGKRGDYSK